MRCRSGDARRHRPWAGFHPSACAVPGHIAAWESSNAAVRRCACQSRGAFPMMRQTPKISSCSDIGDSACAYAELARIVHGAQSLGAVLRRIAEIAHALVPGADEVSITLIECDRARTVAFAGELASALDERQYSSGLGPCLDAAVTGQIIAIDTAADTLYPEFSRQAHRIGIRQCLAVGMPTVHGGTGAVNIYSRAGVPFDDQVLDMATNFAAYAAIAVANAALFAGAQQEVAQMKAAM